MQVYALLQGRCTACALQLFEVHLDMYALVLLSALPHPGQGL